MDNGKISVRYARALLNVANEQHCEDEVYQNLVQLTNHYSVSINAFNEALSNPIISKEEKVALLKTAIGEQPHPCLVHFIDFLTLKKRESKIFLIALKYQEMYRKEKNIVKANVTAAAELEESTLQQLRDFVAETFHAEVEMHVNVNPALIGGFTIDIKHDRLDASIKGRLEKMKNQNFPHLHQGMPAL